MLDFIYTGVYDPRFPVKEIQSAISSTVWSASPRSSEHTQTTAEREEPDAHQFDGEAAGFRSGCPITESASLLALARLKIHITVYLIADKFDMQQLKDYALSQFRAGLMSLNGSHLDIRRSSGFAELLSFAYESTSSHDYGLRAVVTRDCISCGSNWDGTIQAVHDIVMRHEPMAFRFGKEMQGRYGVWSEPLQPPHSPVGSRWGCP